MALHVCRDFLTIGNPLTVYTPFYLLYLQALFLRGVLNYSIVGQTGFNIDSATFLKGTGVAGSLNQGGAHIFAFAPDGYVVSASDINRILVVKSANNPMQNSGLFRVVGINTANNWWYLNYRSGEAPPAESGLTWRLYENENVFYAQINGTGNGNTGTYQSRGSALTNRIILQSPSSLNWQVRIAYEAAVDCGYNTNEGGVGPHLSATSPQTGFTTMPGYGGDSAGDFAAGGEHLHFPMWINVRNRYNYGTTCGLFTHSSTQARFYAWGDDVTGTAFMLARSVISGIDGFIHFGLAEDEEQPLPPKNVQRLFVIGTNSSAGSIGWSCGSNQGRSGMAYGLSNQPVSCIYSLYNALDGQGFPSSTPIRASTYAGDNPYIAATELLPVDLLAGTQDNQSPLGGTLPEVLNLEGRRLGRAPFLRMGRSNYGYFQVASDVDRSWIHLNDGMFLPWKGAILP